MPAPTTHKTPAKIETRFEARAISSSSARD